MEILIGLLREKSFIASLLTLAVATLTLWVVRRQARLMEEQQQTLRGQLEITEKIGELMGRQAKLKVLSKVTQPTERDPNRYLDFSVENVGNKTATDFYWELFIPRDFAHHGFSTVEGEVEPSVEKMDGIEYSRFSGHFDTPVYPSRRVKLGRFPADDLGRKGILEIQWLLVGEDGMFPAEGIRGRTSVPVSPVP